MTQHDYSIANQTFPATRTDLNNVLASILSLNSGTGLPSTTVAGMLAYETDTGIIWQRNAGDSAWVHLWTIGKQGLVDQNGSTIYAADSVGSDSYAITLTPAVTAYAAGQVFNFRAGTANTGACTLAVNGLSAITIKKALNVDLATGDILANQIVTVVYDGTNFQMLSPVSNGLTAATQAEQETGTATAPFVNPAVQHFHPSACKAWVKFNGVTTTAILASYNITSVTDEGTGDTTVTIATDFSGVHFACAAMAEGSTTGTATRATNMRFGGQAAGTIRVLSIESGANTDLPGVHIVMFGDHS
jgi:hypothetical protein